MTVTEITDTINEFDYRLIEEKTEEKEKHRKRRKNTIKKKNDIDCTDYNNNSSNHNIAHITTKFGTNI